MRARSKAACRPPPTTAAPTPWKAASDGCVNRSATSSMMPRKAPSMYDPATGVPRPAKKLNAYQIYQHENGARPCGSPPSDAPGASAPMPPPQLVFIASISWLMRFHEACLVVQRAALGQQGLVEQHRGPVLELLVLVLRRSTTGWVGLISRMGLEIGMFWPAAFRRRARFIPMSCSVGHQAGRRIGQAVGDATSFTLSPRLPSSCRAGP